MELSGGASQHRAQATNSEDELLFPDGTELAAALHTCNTFKLVYYWMIIYSIVVPMKSWCIQTKPQQNHLNGH